MNPNPATDVAGFLTQPGWLTAVFWLFLVASIGNPFRLAANFIACSTKPSQPIRAAGNCWAFIQLHETEFFTLRECLCTVFLELIPVLQ